MTKAIAAAHELSGLALVESHYDAILCDIWGVVHNGVTRFEAASEALCRFRRKGGAVALITNAPRPREQVAAQLAHFGVPLEAYDAILTSGDVTAALVAERLPGKVYHIGPNRDLPVYERAANIAGVAPQRVSLDEADFVVCTGLVDDETEKPDDYASVLKAMAARNLTMICANPDLIVHRGQDLLYCAGALAEIYERMGGTTIQAGKPYAPIYRLALSDVEKALARPLDLARVLAVGDAMNTDINGAVEMGLDSIFVTRGIHRAQLHGSDGTGDFDPEAFRRLIEESGFAPSYAMDRLFW